jgi:hypothetical protein
MKFKAFLIFVCFFQIAFGQVKHPVPTVSSATPKISWIKVERFNKPVTFVSYLVVNEKTDVDTIRIEKSIARKDALSKHPARKEKGEFSGVIIRLKPQSTLMSLDEIIKAYRIPGSEKNLPIVVDDKYITYPDNLYAVKSSINYVRIQNHYYTKKPVIFIRTTKPLPEHLNF